MVKLQVEEAFGFYHKFIFNYTSEKSKTYIDYGFAIQGGVGAKDWEVFAAILMNDRARPGDGVDLMNYEVKSAIAGNSFEYQYHKNHGLDKLAEDRRVGHIFISRSSDYADVEVWIVRRSKMQSKFDEWLPELRENYRNELRQRFRRSISFRFVIENGEKVFAVKNGKLIFPQ